MMMLLHSRLPDVRLRHTLLHPGLTRVRSVHPKLLQTRLCLRLMLRGCAFFCLWARGAHVRACRRLWRRLKGSDHVACMCRFGSTHIKRRRADVLWRTKCVHTMQIYTFSITLMYFIKLCTKTKGPLSNEGAYDVENLKGSGVHVTLKGSGVHVTLKGSGVHVTLKGSGVHVTSGQAVCRLCLEHIPFQTTL